ncbi:hypothetical protein SAMN02745121_06323 [Nannocystis exedens]|uniref:Uncharacterized protein n=1 Tax=Nannocystis exedens TaxID=54 RepID=A0A1I2EY80_9BACT|nr:hypothetical protein [Nannocystis exedens]PCC69516.1 hypothetical protein NAEX_02538 [Nannocystis exedens]SFE97663.1 hypothetical protein SAMN02745121_06323 [Nannocystis exedens]
MTDAHCVLLPGARPERSGADLYAAAYRCWYETWSEAFRELGKQGPLHSDAFTRQQEVCALFLGEQCVALSFMTPVDLEHPFARADSYFHNWSDRALTALARDGALVMINSNFTVHPDARRAAPGFSSKDVILGLCLARFLESPAAAMTGAVRKSRNVHGLVRRWGAVTLEEDRLSGHGDLVDLVAFYKPEVMRRPPLEFDATVRQLWRARTVVRPEAPSPTA